MEPMTSRLIICKTADHLHCFKKKWEDSIKVWTGMDFASTTRASENSTTLGLVVQSIISLTSSLRGQLAKCFATFLLNTLIFFVEKMREALHCKSFTYFFNKKYWHISDISF